MLYSIVVGVGVLLSVSSLRIRLRTGCHRFRTGTGSSRGPVTMPLWLESEANYAWVWILERGGVVNRILVGTGLLDSSLDLLSPNSMGIGFGHNLP